MFERLVLKSGLRFSRLNFASYCVVKSCGKRVRRQSAQVERFLSTWDRYLSGWERYLSGWERYLRGLPRAAGRARAVGGGCGGDGV